MTDFKDLLRNWIERSAEPVSAQEAMRRGSDSAQGRRGLRRNWMAAIAGAALILFVVGLPVLLLQPSTQTEAGPATETTTSPEVTRTEAGPGTSSLEVTPDWEGLAIEEVRVEADRLGITLHEERAVTEEAEPGTVIRQEPAPGAALDDNRTVIIAVVGEPQDSVATTSAPRPDQICPLTESAPSAGERYVNVFYGCRLSLENQVQPVLRAFPSESPDFERAAFQALLEGPTPAEIDSGIETAFGAGTAGLLESVTFDDGNLRVDLNPGIRELSLSDSDITALFATGFQFETIALVELTIEGSCEAFSEWSGRDCSMDADNWWHKTSQELIAGWPSVVTRPTRVTGSCEVPSQEPGPDMMAVTVLYSCRAGGDALLNLTPVTRLVPAGSDPMVARLNELVKGPNGAELAAGISGTFLSERTARMVKSVNIEGSRAIVDFRPFVRSPAISNIGTSTGGTVFNTELNANIFQNPDIEEIEYRVNGSCDAYWSAFEAFCSIQTRENFERAVEELS